MRALPPQSNPWVDEGGYIRNYYKALNGTGFVGESDCPWYEVKLSYIQKREQVITQPDVMCYEKASDNKNKFSYHAIDLADRKTQIKQALAMQKMVAFGMLVGDDFRGWTPGKPPVQASTQDPSAVDGHSMVLHSYGVLSNGQEYVEGVNSWGSYWGDGGHFKLSWDCVAQAFEFWVLEALAE